MITSTFDSLNDEEFVEICYQRILRRGCDSDGKSYYLNALKTGLSRLAVIESLLTSEEFNTRSKVAEFVLPGHFYSAIPSDEDIDRHHSFDWNPPELPGIDLRQDEQMQLLERFREFYPDIPFSAEKKEGLRYKYCNPTYSYADAIFLHSMIRELTPRRIIEIGSGNSTCVILDTNEQFFNNQIECSFIEPYADYLRSLLTREESKEITLIERKLQDIDISFFDQLEGGDILFVDSTHVVKLGSDVNLLLFEILPRLRMGVSIHFHDVFYPFEYPVEWFEEGRAWNEQYVLRAFLQFNDAFKITLFSTYMIRTRSSWFQQFMPDCLKDPGGSLWIEKT
jgi:hypothetical protein